MQLILCNTGDELKLVKGVSANDECKLVFLFKMIWFTQVFRK